MTFKNIYDFGLNIGMAFQIQDDYLDLYGNEKTFGKKIGNDIITNKKTFLYIKALQKAKGKEHKTLINLYSKNHSLEDEQKIERIRSIYEKLNIKEETSATIEFYYKKAIENISLVDLAKRKKRRITNFCQKHYGQKILNLKIIYSVERKNYY